jgi:hypothetical protein
MGDTTPDSEQPQSAGRDEAPPWFPLLIVMIAAFGGLWVLWTFFNSSGY